MRTLLAAALALLLAPAIARSDTLQTSSPEAQGMSSRELAGLIEFGIANGMDSVLVVRNGRIVAEAYYAPFAPGTKHRLNSATKSVTGSLIAIALMDGLIRSVDQPVLDFFPERQFNHVDERKKALTLRHLLDMTSGLDWTEPVDGGAMLSFGEMERSPDWVQFALDRPMAREPGSAFDYNTGNTHVLSAILSKVTGRRAEDYAREKLFGPLGIEDVQWRRDPQGMSGGGAGLYLQPRDMAKLGTLWLGDGVWEGRRLLPTGWINDAKRAAVARSPGPTSISAMSPDTEWHYGGLFWFMPAKGVYAAAGHNRQFIVVMPEFDVVATFTGSFRYRTPAGIPGMPQYPWSAVLDRLRSAIKSPSPLPEDLASVVLLADKTREVAQEVRTPSAQPSPLAATISGKVYRLQPNRLSLATLSFTFEDGAAAYTYEIDGQRFGGPVGLDGLLRVGGRRHYGQSAAKGLWQDEKAFQLELQTLGNDDLNMATFTFDGNKISGRVSTSRRGSWVDLGGDPTDTVVLRGEAVE